MHDTSSSASVPASSAAALTRLEPIVCGRIGCGARIAWHEAQCPVCLTTVAPPNVRLAQAERAVLLERYAAARTILEKQDILEKAEIYEGLVASARAVQAMDARLALQILQGSLHQNYHSGVRGLSRKPAEFRNSCMRNTVDGRVFGDVAREIFMAALTLDGWGLPSYGNVFFEFKDVVCRQRASCLVENSYTFVQNHPGADIVNLPAGYRAAWEDRGKLAVVKLAAQITGENGASVAELLKDERYQNALLTPSTSRDGDAFIEVHIYGCNYDFQALKAIRAGALGSGKMAEALFEELRNHAELHNLTWEHRS